MTYTPNPVFPLPPPAALEAALGEAPPAGLAQCADYVWFPLLMMLDAVVVLRQDGGKQAQQQAQQAQQDGPPGGEAAALMALPAMASDRAAEAALGCVLALARRCPPASGEGLLGLLRRLAALLELPPGTASEELRLQVRGPGHFLGTETRRHVGTCRHLPASARLLHAATCSAAHTRHPCPTCPAPSRCSVWRPRRVVRRRQRHGRRCRASRRRRCWATSPRCCSRRAALPAGCMWHACVTRNRQ